MLLTPSAATGPAANSIASGIPSSFRHISATNGASLVGENEIAASCRHALDKELHRRIAKHGIRRLLRIGWRKIEGKDAAAMFALYLQQFTTRGQKMDLLGFLEELLGQRSDRLDHVLTAIENDKQLSRTDEIDQFQAGIVRFQ